MSETLIRSAQAGDVPGLLALFRDVASERMWIGTEPGFDRARYEAGWNAIIAGDRAALFVALEGAAVVGSLSVTPSADFGCEIGMLVALAHRRKGIGGRLLDEAVRWARDHGHAELALLVFPHNTAAIALYERYGFTEKSRLPGFKTRQNGERWDVIVMTRAL